MASEIWKIKKIFHLILEKIGVNKLKWIKHNLKHYSDRVGKTFLYWKGVSHHIELIKKYKKVFDKYIDINSKLLDVGAGRLFYKKILSEYTNHYESIDFKKTHQELNYIGTSSKTNRTSNSYDIIFCSQVLEHVPDPNESFKEIYKILKKNGIAIISTPFFMYLHNEPYDYFRYTKYALKKFSLDNHFIVLKLEEIGGLGGFLGNLLNALLIGLFWNIPILNYIMLGINVICQYLLYVIDKIIPTRKLFPSHYLLVIKKK